ncbi:hypothetical protein FKM82_010171 [Ascaphus truei]
MLQSDASTSKGSLREMKVCHKHFEEAFKKVRPSVSKKDQLMYEQLRRSLS